MKKLKRNKIKFLSVRVKESDYTKLRNEAKKKKVSFSDYIRDALLG